MAVVVYIVAVGGDATASIITIINWIASIANIIYAKVVIHIVAIPNITINANAVTAIVICFIRVIMINNVPNIAIIK